MPSFRVLILVTNEERRTNIATAANALHRGKSLFVVSSTSDGEELFPSHLFAVPPAGLN
jgi:hypothetical protein